MYSQQKRTRTPSIGGASYTSRASYASHTTLRSTTRSVRSVKSVKIPWYKKPILQSAIITDLQKGAMAVGIFTLFLSLFTFATSVFDLYCLAEAAPGTTHYGYFIISFEFVYVGNPHIRNILICIALFSLILAIVLLVTSCILIRGLRKEYEKNIIPWLYCMAVFTIWRIFSFLFSASVNDMIFAYHILMLLFWLVSCCICVFGWVVVYSLYLELSDLTRLEDLAHLRMDTLTSIHNMSHSMPGSRPTTPHSIASTFVAT